MVADAGRNVVNMDPGVYSAMGRLTTAGRSPPSERFEQASWLTMRIPQQDLVLADGAINMLEHTQHGRFLASISSSLKPGGVALLHVHIARPPPFDNADAIFKWFREGPAKQGFNAFTATRIYCTLTFFGHKAWSRT